MFVKDWIVISCVVWLFHQVLVCNYGPAGNIEGAPVYEQGETGSNCPKGTTKTPLGLCANDENWFSTNNVMVLIWVQKIFSLFEKSSSVI